MPRKKAEEAAQGGPEGTEALDRLLEQWVESSSQALIEALERSRTFRGLAELLETLSQRIETLEARVEALQAEEPAAGAARTPAPGPAEPPPPPAPAAAPPAPVPTGRPAPETPVLPVEPARPAPVAPPPAPRLSVPLNVSLSPGGQRSLRPKTRGRTTSRPTVVYRTDPRGKAGPLGPSAIPLPPPKRPQPKGKKEGGTKGVFALLYDEKGRRTLAGFINQMKFDRRDLVQRLNVQYAGMPGVPLEEEDVMVALHYHQLGDALRKREGVILCRHLAKQRGSLAKTAQAMKVEPERLKSRITELQLEDEVARVRNGFREEVMERTPFAERLALALTREKYLTDLDIVTEVDASLQRELREELDRLPADPNAEARGQALRQKLGLEEQAYRRMVRRYGLAEELGLPQAAPGAGEDGP
jgi:hypothetical protein